VEWLRVFFYQRHLLTGREQSTFSVWSSPSWTRRRLLDALTRELRRIAASEYRVEVDSGRVCLSLAGTLHRNMRVWRRSGITAFGQKTPILIAYRRLEGGANPISLSLSLSLLCFCLFCSCPLCSFARAKLIYRLHRRRRCWLVHYQRPALVSCFTDPRHTSSSGVS
jgi:hypothetical protein